jgi:peroxiredoxin
MVSRGTENVARRRGLRIALATAAIGLAVGGGLWLAARRGPKLAPDFAVTGLDGRTVRLSALRGKVVVLNLWATWCAPCVEEMPSMERLWTALRDDDFALLAVSQDEEGGRVVAPFVERMRLSLPVFLDPDRQVGDRYGVWGYPETFVIDRNGYVVERVIGPRDWSTAEQVAALRTLIGAGDGRAGSDRAPRGPS